MFQALRGDPSGLGRQFCTAAGFLHPQSILSVVCGIRASTLCLFTELGEPDCCVTIQPSQDEDVDASATSRALEACADEVKAFGSFLQQHGYTQVTEKTSEFG